MMRAPTMMTDWTGTSESKAGQSLALRCNVGLQLIIQVRYLRAGLIGDLGECIASPSEILLCQQ